MLWLLAILTPISAKSDGISYFDELFVYYRCGDENVTVQQYNKKQLAVQTARCPPNFKPIACLTNCLSLYSKETSIDILLKQYK